MRFEDFVDIANPKHIGLIICSQQVYLADYMLQIHTYVMSRPSITPQFSAIDLGSLDDALRMDVVITSTLSKDIFENEFDSLI